MPELSAAPSINDSRKKALLELIARLADLDLAPLLIYRIDSVPAGALPFPPGSSIFCLRYGS
jgi:hypothetical protein